MKKTMQIIATVSLMLLLLFSVWHALCPAAWLFTAAISAGTTAYHFCMRFLVGGIVDRIMHNRADCSAPWFRMRAWEQKLYARIGVKSWKDRLPSYDPSLFSPKQHTWNEIAQAMCQSEIVHEVIVVLSFLPLAASLRFGTFFAFFLTSLAAALFDLQFVILQRYNRPRILRLIDKSERK